LEEARFVAMFRTIGVKVWQEESEGKQFRVSQYGGHYGSAIDGVLLGIPEMPEEPVLAEMKTHNAKYFKKLAGEKNREGDVVVAPEGVKKAKLEHYVQMQQYMGYFKLAWGLYCAVCKDTDELYFELVPYDPDCDEHFKHRAQRIIFAAEAPPKISNNESFWKCKYCDERRVCHFGDAPELNCRTCAAATPQTDGTWYCKTHSAILDKSRQLSGCSDWQMHTGIHNGS
jgi:CRISPR/Cas system-associated exonuclease Cas4 (RecB family)